MIVDIARAEAIPGFMSRDELTWLAQQAVSAPTILEVGSWQGRSTRALADHGPGTVYAIDPWDGPYFTDAGDVHPIQTNVYDAFAQHLADHITSGRVVPIRAQSFDALRDTAQFSAGGVDLVFLDGDHRYDAVVDDIAGAIGLLRPGGILAGHDYGHRDWPGVRRAVDAWFGPRVSRCKSIWWLTP